MIFLPVFLLLVSSAFGQTTYYAYKTQLNWPNEQLNLTTLYDGLDSVYLFGFDDQDVVMYSIESDSLEHVVTFPDGIRAGGAHFDSEGNIIYIPGNFIGGGPIYKINPSDRSVETVAITDFDVFTSYFGKGPNGEILSSTNAFFDLVPQPANVSVFNPETSTSEVVMQVVFPNKVHIPVDAGNGTYHFPTRYSDCSGFPTWPCRYSNHVVTIDTNTNTYTQRSVQIDFTNIPNPRVWADDRMLLLNKTAAIEIKLDQPLARMINLVGVEPDYYTQAVYVASLERIYIFGGEGISGVWYFEVQE